MKRELLLIKLLGSAAVLACGVILIEPSEARPYPDRPGLCYFFSNNELELLQNCIVSTGYGTGIHYAVLRWQDGVVTRILQDWSANTSTVDGEASQSHLRDASWYGVVEEEETEEEVLRCERLIANNNSVCFKFTD